MERQVVDAVKECETMIRTTIVEANLLIDRLNAALYDLKFINNQEDAAAFVEKHDTLADDFEFIKLV